METQEEQVVNLLWTGGWDSTFRVLQLAQKRLILQPYYLRDNRESEALEIGVIKAVIAEIRKSSKFPCRIRDLIIGEVSAIPEDEQIEQAYNNILRKTYFGSQYNWLARVAKQIDRLELMIHSDDKGFDVIRKYGAVNSVKDPILGEYYEIDQDLSSREVNLLFGKYRFPLLDYTKLQMKTEAAEKGFLSLMDQTWFCYKPRNGQPCGTSNPCKYTIEEGMGYRIGKNGMRRYRLRKFRSMLAGVKSRLRSAISS